MIPAQGEASFIHEYPKTSHFPPCHQTDDVSNQHWYARFKIQPIDFIEANNLGYHEGNVVKYICRYPFKGTPVKDLKKARDYIDRLIDAKEEK